MKKGTLTLLMVIIGFSILAQEDRTIDDLLKQREVKKLNYFFEKGLNDAVVINMSFGQSEVISNSDREALKNGQIFQVDLVFSNYPVDFDMTELHTKRMKVVQSLRPDAITNSEIKWNIIRQMRCKNEAEAKILFHGVVIHYKKAQSIEVSAEDTHFLKEFLPDPVLKSTPKTEIRETSSATVLVTEATDISGEISVLAPTGTVSYLEGSGCPTASIDYHALRTNLPDSTVIKILNRNKWNDMVVVSDLTGSMSPYVAQLVLWFKLNEKNRRVSQVTFFNDGDMTPDRKKIIGNTRGIYHCDGGEYGTVRELALTTVSKGYGGDGPENDCEAIIAAIKRHPKAKEVILIADNLAPIKDVLLLDEIDRPVRIVLCGTQYGINIQYLELARRTGGSVHTMEEDLTDLISKKEGSTFKLNGKFYQIKDNKVTEVIRTMRL